MRRPRKKKRGPPGVGGAAGGEEGEEEDASGEEEGEEENQDQDEQVQRMEMPQPAKEKSVPDRPAQDPVWGEDSQDVEMGDAGGAPAAGGINKERCVFLSPSINVVIAVARPRPLILLSNRMALFRKRFARLYENELRDEDQVLFNTLVELINQALPTDQLFGTTECTAIIEAMGEENELMMTGGVVYKI